MTRLYVEKLRIEGIEDVRRILEGPHTSCVPLGSGVPKGSIFRATVGNVVLRAGELAADIRTRTGIDTNAISFVTKLESEASLFSFRSGTEILPGDVYRLVRGDVNDYRLYGQLRYAVISLSADLLLTYCENALLSDIAFWEQREWFRASAATRGLLARNVGRLASQIPQLDGKTVTGPALEQLQSALVEPFLWAVMLDDERFDERHALSSATIVQKVEDLIDGLSPETVKVAGLCGALHCSRRTLHRAFAETMGIGPVRYLTLKRLAGVRAELRRSDPVTTRVTETATKYGFWDLGRFAKDYRQTFGEKPSETLRKGTSNRKGFQVPAVSIF